MRFKLAKQNNVEMENYNRIAHKYEDNQKIKND